jgi:5-(aminomethyl)-3-furanmethanol phosphate kinase
MWVVKIGGSLADDPVLASWLQELASLGGGRVVIVSGGGDFADQVRLAQARWHFDELAAHNMAVLAMAQGAYMLQGLCPDLVLAFSEADIGAALRRAKVPVWVPLPWLLGREDESLASWELTSDSLAAWLANQLNAERLLLVKSCEVAPGQQLQDWVAAGIVDAQLPKLTQGASYPVELMHKRDLPALRRELLHGSAPH